MVRLLFRALAFAATKSYELVITSLNSTSDNASNRSTITHLYRPTYGAGTMPSSSVRAANDSGSHLQIIVCGTEANPTMAKILPRTLKHSSSPHCNFSVAWGNDKHNFRTES